jgi:hypothetical protein
MGQSFSKTCTAYLGRAGLAYAINEKTTMIKTVSACILVGLTALVASESAPPGTEAAPAVAPSCAATPTSLTPVGYERLIPATHAPASSLLRVVKDVPLPGPASRFDYQSFDATTGRLWMNHMNAGETLVFSTSGEKLVGVIKGLPLATGVLAVPSLHKTFVSAAGAHELVTIDDRTLRVVGHAGGIQFPDGISYAADAGKVFVSDESGSADVVIDALTGKRRSTIPLGGEAGNTHYDSVSHCVLVAEQTTNALIALDPVSERIVQRYPLPGSKHPHGFTMDQPGRLLFMSSEGNAKLTVIDMTTMRVIASHPVGDTPDVLAWDATWRRLYVASESGILSAFWADGTTLVPAGEYRAPHAHTVGLDTRTHRIYLPLQNVEGRPVLRILAPSP